MMAFSSSVCYGCDGGYCGDGGDGGDNYFVILIASSSSVCDGGDGVDSCDGNAHQTKTKKEYTMCMYRG